MDKKTKPTATSSRTAEVGVNDGILEPRPMAAPAVVVRDESHYLVKKHVGAIQIVNDISLQARKLWNFLLNAARDKLETEDEHEVSLAEIRAHLQWKNNNIKELLSLLRALTKTDIGWGILDDETMRTFKELGVSTLLAGATYSDGVLRYSFYKRLRPLLANPEVFGMINIMVSASLKTKGGLALYENAVVYIDPATGEGTSELIEAERLYLLLGVSPEREMRDVKRNVLLPGMKDVNTNANVELELLEERAGRGRGGKIRGVRLRVKYKQVEHGETGDLLTVIDRELVNEMMGIGVTEAVACEFAATYPAQDLRDKLEYTREKMRQKHLKTPAGFFSTAVRGNWKTNRGQEELQLPEPASAKEVKRATKDMSKEKQAPEWAWFDSLPPEDQSALVTSFMNTHTLTELQLQKLTDNGPRDPYVIVPFSHHLRSKRNLKTISIPG